MRLHIAGSVCYFYIKFNRKDNKQSNEKKIRPKACEYQWHHANYLTFGVKLQCKGSYSQNCTIYSQNCTWYPPDVTASRDEWPHTSNMLTIPSLLDVTDTSHTHTHRNQTQCTTKSSVQRGYGLWLVLPWFFGMIYIEKLLQKQFALRNCY